jgi:hypothetical protein
MGGWRVPLGLLGGLDQEMPELGLPHDRLGRGHVLRTAHAHKYSTRTHTRTHARTHTHTHTHGVSGASLKATGPVQGGAWLRT